MLPSHTPATYLLATPLPFRSVVQRRHQAPLYDFHPFDSMPAAGNLDPFQHHRRNNVAYHDMNAASSNMTASGGENYHTGYPESSQRSFIGGQPQEYTSQPQVTYSTGDSTSLSGVVNDNNALFFASYAPTSSIPSHPGGAGTGQIPSMRSPIMPYISPGASTGVYSPISPIEDYQSHGPHSHVEQRFHPHPATFQRHSPVRARDGSTLVRGVSANGVGIPPSLNETILVDVNRDNEHLYRVPATSPEHAAKTPPDPSRSPHPREPEVEKSIQYGASRRHWHVAKSGDSQPHANRLSKRSARKSKMHQCLHCSKSFPRPSGLVTHMNIHTGDRPHRCEWCPRTFTVRSNAKRHLKTHGVIVQAEKSASPDYKVAFDKPIVTKSSDVAIDPPVSVKWMQCVVSGMDQLRMASSSPAGTPGTYPRPPASVPSSMQVAPSGNTTLIDGYRRI